MLELDQSIDPFRGSAVLLFFRFQLMIASPRLKRKGKPQKKEEKKAAVHEIVKKMRFFSRNRKNVRLLQKIACQIGLRGVY
ncbi:MAG: hypothetical protein SOX25_04895 [Eubacteriales bacterium]|nr:hypothetical protein [Eubacteriales bacterium]